MLTKFEERTSNLVWDIVTGGETWIYSYDPKTKQQWTVWIYRDESKPTKVALASFLNKAGHVTTLALENCPTVNSNWYMTNRLPELKDKLHKNNRKPRIILHHNNANSHTAKQTNKFLK
ncbi:hypothetical protein EVAR_27104_1 [Eumeta japonica]|uniref:Mariner Mos1 transposase n=1 Tax=Eumeta variegata TaxID=151549 RepID=A0A4C1VML5_EUMVA|nr:hypothetical protein EVAR_27104_1 [Eumeta japonica]